MNRRLSHIMGKNIQRVSFILLLIAGMTLVGTPRVHAETPIIISLDPVSYEAPAPGHSFTINVTISNVGNETVGLGAIDFYLRYNTTILDALTTHLTPTSTNYLADYVGLRVPYSDTAPINDTAGMIRWAAIVKDIYNPFVGSGALLTIDFNATAEGSCALDLYDTILGWVNPTTFETGEYVLDTDYSVVDGFTAVIPEFPSALIMPLLLIATLAATFLGKTVWSRKRKDAPAAEWSKTR